MGRPVKEGGRASDDGRLHRCRDCGEEKAASAFYKVRGRSGYTDRPMCRCILCHSKRTKEYHLSRYPTDVAYRRKVLDSTRAAFIRRKFGLSKQTYAEMVKRQNGKCSICATTQNRNGTGKCQLAIDHCHKTGKVRGLLCGQCNLMLGHAKDRHEVLQSAADYLRKHS